MKTEKEIDNKIEELMDEDNFTDFDIDYCNGGSETRFDIELSRNTLKDFSKWLLNKKD